jgi:hypothetical protein
MNYHLIQQLLYWLITFKESQVLDHLFGQKEELKMVGLGELNLEVTLKG